MTSTVKSLHNDNNEKLVSNNISSSLVPRAVRNMIHKAGMKKAQKQQELEHEGKEQRQKTLGNISGIFVDSMPNGVSSAFLTSATRENTE